MKLEKAAFDDIPSRGVIAVAGAGGKTTLIHCLAARFRKKGLRVLITTTTHMLRESDTVTDPGAARHSLQTAGYAFAGAVDPGNERKITAFPDKVLRTLVLAADVTLIEADGARGLPFKAPQPWEPVVPRGAAGVIFVMGMDACGKDVREVCYNPEGVSKAMRGTEAGIGEVRTAEAEVPQKRPDPGMKAAKNGPVSDRKRGELDENAPAGSRLLLTEEKMLRVYEQTYLKPYTAGGEGRSSQGGPALFILQNYKEGKDHLFDSFWRVRAGCEAD